jgi:diguanylate cyclase (GGDEF)-like protein
MNKILIVDDEPVNLKLLGKLLGDRFEISYAENAKAGIASALSSHPDLILADVMMPDMDGYDMCRKLKENIETESIPVIFITAKTDLDDVVHGFDAGGVDYIAKPFNSRELNARIKTHIALVEANKELKLYAESMEMISQKLLAKSQQLDSSARTDFLTGLSNRMHIFEYMAEEALRIKRGTPSCSVIISDLDHFKLINDTYGHECGDYVLKTVSAVMRTTVREQDIVARWGGEEFLFLLPETAMDGAFMLAEKLRSAIETAEFIYKDTSLHITMTFGVAQFDTALGVEGTIKKADDALYLGKRDGRNRVVQG